MNTRLLKVICAAAACLAIGSSPLLAQDKKPVAAEKKIALPAAAIVAGPDPIDEPEPTPQVAVGQPASVNPTLDLMSSSAVDRFTGANTVSVPLAIPDAPTNLTPSLALSYSQFGAADIAGVGWSLPVAYVERQSRKGVDLAGDAFFASVEGDEGDLVASDGAYRFQVDHRQTQLRKFVAADGTVTWKAYLRSGLIYTFGTTADSRVSDPLATASVLRWYVTQVEDRSGNRIEYTYRAEERTSYLVSIAYGATATSGHLYTIELTYEARPDAVSRFDALGTSRVAKRLGAVAVIAAGRRQRSYLLDYGAPSAATNRSLLRSVTLQGRDGGKLPPIRLDYSEAKPNWAIRSMGGAGVIPEPFGNRCLVGNFGGQGRTDIACYDAGGNWKTMLAAGKSWAPAVWGQGASPASAGADCLAGDFDGDTLTDIACHAGGGSWAVARSTGSGWKTETWVNAGAPGRARDQCFAGDVDGDGRADLACLSAGNVWKISKSTGSAWQTADWGGGPAPAMPLGDHCVMSDLNADAKQDIACNSGGGTWSVGLSTGSAWTTGNWTGGPTPAVMRTACQSGDFNGDGLVDIGCRANNAAWQVALSTGRGWSMATWDGGPAGEDCVGGDLNGDGLADLACYVGGAWVAAQSTGSAWAGLALPGGMAVAVPAASRCMAGQLTDDVRAEIACYSHETNNWSVLTADEGFSDLLSGLTNALGGEIRFDYASTASGSNRLGAIYPVIRSVTRRLDGEDDVSGYAYEGGAANMAERDFRGFAKVVESKLQPNGTLRVSKTTLFHQGAGTDASPDDPGVVIASTKSMPISEELRDAAGTVLARSTYDYTVDGVAVLLPHLKTVVSEECDAQECWRKARASYEYDELGNLRVKRDEGDMINPADGVVTTTTYLNDTANWLIGLPASVTQTGEQAADPALAKTTLVYDGPDGCPLTASQGPLRRGVVTLVRKGDAVSGTVVQASGYTATGALACQGNAGGVTRFVYDASNRFLLQTVGPLTTRRMTYHGIGQPVQPGGYYGAPRTAQLPSGEKTTYSYDEFGREKRRAADDGSWVETTYQDTGRPLEQGVTTSWSNLLSRRSILDGFGRLRRTLETGAAGRLIEVNFRYDLRDLLVERSQPFFEGAATHASHLYAYDELGRRISAIDADGRAVETCYRRNRVITVDPKGRKQVQEQNVFGQTIRLSEYTASVAACDDDAGAVYSAVSLAYDPLGRLVSRRGGDGAEIRITYDTAGRLLTRVDPDRGITSYGYDAASNIADVGNGAGEHVFLTYDGENRLVQKDFLVRKKAGAGDWVLRYDRATFFGKGRLTSVRGPRFAQELKYDGSGRIAETVYKVAGKSQRFTNQYDPLGRIKQRTFPNGKSLQYRYDGANISAILLDGADVFRVTQQNAASAATEMVYGNGAVRRRTYGSTAPGACSLSLMRLCVDDIVGPDGASLAHRLMQYNDGGDVDTTTQDYADARAPGGIRHTSFQYAYDLWGRLTGYTTDNVAVGYTYDNVGNIDLAGARAGSLTYKPIGAPGYRHAPSVAFGGAIDYDAAGRVRGYQGKTLGWDAEGHLITVRGGALNAAFLYDAGGTRIARLDGGMTSELTLQGDYRCTPSGCRITVRHGGETIASRGDDGSISYFVEDYLRSTRLVLHGTQIEYVKAFPYGELENADAGDIGEVRFAKSRYEPDLGLYFMGDRVYDPRVMRFLTPDRSDAGLATFQGGNLYAYALNNPLSFSDESGYSAEPKVGTYAGGTPGTLNRAGWTPQLKIDAAINTGKIVGGWSMIVVGAVSIETGVGGGLIWGGVALQTQGVTGLAITLSRANGTYISDQDVNLAMSIAGGGWGQTLTLGAMAFGNRDSAEKAGLLGSALDFGFGGFDAVTSWGKMTSGERAATAVGTGLSGYSLGVDYSKLGQPAEAPAAPVAPRPSPAPSGGDRGGRDAFDGWHPEPRDPTPAESKWPNIDA